jgi:prepilin-type N-terminal cleavage/methylation domain-containing protein
MAMIFHRLRLINKKQQGFTLLELMLAMAISGIITGVITMTIFQVVTGTARTNNHMVAVRQAQNAGFFVSRDVQMAQIVVTDPDPDGFPLALTWTDWSGTVNNVTYTLDGTELIRNHNGQQSPVAQFIGSVEVSPRPYTGGKLIFMVTATVGSGSQAQSETRTYEIVPRPGS